MDLRGKELGNYQILEEIGRGGMAVVYRAYQPSLNRHVAIKILPPQLGLDQQFVERFQREAQAAAGLRHPNIVVIHDVGHQEGVYYIVMEYLEGQTLRELVEREGPLPQERAIRITEQIASALDYAHQRGFVHRDVKPANIFVSEGDRVTLTDFGIAKAASETQHLTRTGMLVGTPEYMSPEQAEGGRIDHRTDLYALGIVLFQMLVGRVPFRGTTPHAVLHAIIYEPPPPPRELNPNLAPATEDVIMRAIAKEPDRRFQRASDMVSALKSAPKAHAAGMAVPPPSRTEVVSRRRTSPLVWIIGALILVVVVLLSSVFLLLKEEGTPEPPIAISTQATVSQTPGIGATNTAFQPTEAPVTGEPGITDTQPPPTSSPQLPTDTVAPPTDTPQAATDTPLAPTDTAPPPTDTTPPSPSPPPTSFGRLAFSSNRDGNPEIYVMNLAGGSPLRLTNTNANDWLPDWSPDGSRLAFTSQRTGSYDLWVMSADGSAQTAWISTGGWDEYARWAPDGQRLSLSTTATTQGVANSEIFVRQPSGNLQQITSSTAEDQWADWSPDGRLVYTEGFKDQSDWDIYVVSGDGGVPTAWLDEATCDVQPTWSPDGQWIGFLRMSQDTNVNGRIDFEDSGDIWIGRSSGGALRQVTSGLWAVTPTWSPDSQWIAFARILDSNGNGRSDSEDRVDIWAVPISGGEPLPLVQSPHRDGDPSWTW
jgi:serine/threonine protein kinase